MICFICYDQIPKQEQVSIEYASLSNNKLRVNYKYFHLSCFEECGLSLEDLISKKTNSMFCPWCNVYYGYSSGVWYCVQIILLQSVISRPCSNCWNKHGISLE